MDSERVVRLHIFSQRPEEVERNWNHLQTNMALAPDPLEKGPPELPTAQISIRCPDCSYEYERGSSFSHRCPLGQN
jgi:hypothetical protein